MSEKLVSIVVPVYNTEPYLTQCLNSLVDQTYKNLEIIVINDGSTDNSQEVIDKFARQDSRVVAISQSNQGVSKARNNAIQYVTGDYVMYIDSDDWIDIDVCEKVLFFAENNHLDVVMWPYKREYTNITKDTLLFNQKSVLWEEKTIRRLYRRLFGPLKSELQNPEKLDSISTACIKLYSAELIRNIKFVDIKEFGTGEDTFYNIQVFANVKRAGYISDVFYHYRKDDLSSLTHKYKKNLAHQWLNLYYKIENEIETHGLGDEFKEALSNRICCGLIGLGLNLAEDGDISFKNKTKELKHLLNMEHYKEALKKLDFSYLSLRWKVFFFFAKHKMPILFMLLLCVMNRLRGR